MRKVLVVEDDSDILSILTEFLSETLKYDVTSANSGEDALEKFSDQEIVFTDWKMPNMDGLKLATKLKQLNPYVYIIMVTSNSTVENALQGLMAGANDYITKPFDLTQIEVRTHLAEATLAINKAKMVR